MRRRLRAATGPALLAAAAALAVAGCGSSGSGVATPTIPAARTFHLSGFQPAAKVAVGKPVDLAFTIVQPSGAPLTSYKRGPGPHTGVHLILVRDDLDVIIHRHPRVGPEGRISQQLVFPEPGPYRVVIDVYPNIPGGQPNFQLFAKVDAQGAYKPRPLPPFAQSVSVDGFSFAIHGRPRLKAIEPAFLTVVVRARNGSLGRFTPWFGALAHAIFFHQGSLDYFHTHVCGAGAGGCTSLLGATRVTGTSTAPGTLTVGVLVPEPGLWRLFLQCRVDGKIVTAPFTLMVT
jgi:hypothetical protein